MWELDGRPDDPAGLELRATDIDSAEPPDLLGDRLNSTSGTRWSLDLDDPYAWTCVPDAVEPPAS